MTEIADLQRLLADLRAELRRGRYARLPEVLPVLEARVSELMPGDAAVNESLKAEARRTSRAARAALQGIRAGQRRVAELMRIEAGFLSYDAGGTAETAAPPPSLSRQL